MNFSVTEARAEQDVRALERLYALYLHDLSDYTDHYSLDADARWEPEYLSYWLTHADVCHSLLGRVDDVSACFALVAQKPFPYMSDEADLRIAEFFVARPYRRRAIGKKLLDATLPHFHGVWQVTVLAKNEPALAFWSRVLPADVRSTRDASEVTFWPTT